MRPFWNAMLLCLMSGTVGAQETNPPGPGPETPPAPAIEAGVPEAGEAVWVGGLAGVGVESVRGTFQSGAVLTDTPLPEGYPRPTAPGVIEIKTYPSVRRAEFSDGNAPNALSSNMGFWPLFQHIKERDIAMTAPVEMDYPGLEPEQESKPAAWTMSFLYRSRDLGPTGEFGPVVVRDLPPITVVSLGYQGPYALEWAKVKLAELETWLEAQDEWERAGEPRLMHYNGPSVPASRRWAEVQIPVIRAASPDANEAPTARDGSGRP